MKRHRGSISLIISLGIHIILMLVISPFILRQFNIINDDLSLTVFRIGKNEQVKRRVIRHRKITEFKRPTDDGSSIISPAAPKHNPEMNPPKAPIYDNAAPEIVTFTDIPQTNAYALPNVSFGKDVEAAGPVVMLNRRGAGGTTRGPGRGGSGTGGPGSSIHKGLSDIDSVDDLASIELDENIMGLGIFDTDVLPGHGLIGQVFIPRYAIQRMPDFRRLTPIYTFATAKLDVSPRDYTEGFPTPKKQTVLENFAIQFRGKLAINTPGQYFFELYSDDGAQLYINGQLVVDNDGVHGPVSSFAYLHLTAGFHPVEIHYFQGPRYQIALQWFYKPPNRPRRQIVPPEVIFHPGEHNVQDELRKLKNRLR